MSDKILDDIIAKATREEEEREAKEKQTALYSKDAQEKIKQRPPVHGGALHQPYEEGSRNTRGNSDAYVAGLKQKPELRDQAKQKMIDAGTPESEATYTTDRAYKNGVAKSDGPTPKPQETGCDTEYVLPAIKSGEYLYDPFKPPIEKPYLFKGAAGRGEMVMVSGPPGSGKSTFARVETVIHAKKFRSVWMIGNDQSAQKALQNVCLAMGIDESDFPHDRIKIVEIGKLLRSKAMREGTPNDRAQAYLNKLNEAKELLGGLDIIINDNVLELLTACSNGVISLAEQQSCNQAMAWIISVAEMYDALIYNVWQGTKNSSGVSPHSLALLGMHEIGYCLMRNIYRVRRAVFDKTTAKRLEMLEANDVKARIIRVDKSRETIHEELNRAEGDYIWRITASGNAIEPMDDVLVEGKVIPKSPYEIVLDLFKEGYTCSNTRELRGKVAIMNTTLTEVLAKLKTEGSVIKGKCCGHATEIYHYPPEGGHTRP